MTVSKQHNNKTFTKMMKTWRNFEVKWVKIFLEVTEGVRREMSTCGILAL